MDNLITALVAQENAAQYFQRGQRFQMYGMWAADIRASVAACQERAAHHARIAREAMGIVDDLRAYTFWVEWPSGSGFERNVTAADEEGARKALWVGLTDDQRDNVASIECVDEVAA